MLEGHDYPRSRLLEAESLVAQFEAILSGDLNSARKDANDASHKGVSDHAHNVLKLHLAASELMSSRYNDAKQKIADEYSKVHSLVTYSGSSYNRRKLYLVDRLRRSSGLDWVLVFFSNS